MFLCFYCFLSVLCFLFGCLVCLSFFECDFVRVRPFVVCVFRLGSPCASVLFGFARLEFMLCMFVRVRPVVCCVCLLGSPVCMALTRAAGVRSISDRPTAWH